MNVRSTVRLAVVVAFAIASGGTWAAPMRAEAGLESGAHQDASPFEGHWKIYKWSPGGGKGTYKGTADFVVKGKTLSGTVQNSRDTAKLTNTKLDGTFISFITYCCKSNNTNSRHWWKGNIAADGKSIRFNWRTEEKTMDEELIMVR